MSQLCEFCKNLFVTKSALLHHQQSAKYCLKIQGIQITKYICSNCNKSLSDKRMLDIHEEKCGLSDKVKNLQDTVAKLEKQNTLFQQQIAFYKETIKDLKIQNSELQYNLKDVAVQGVKKSTTTTNNIVNIENLTDEWLKTSSKNLTLEHIQRGPQGYAEFASQHSLKDRVKCVDFARKILQYKEDDGLVRDKKGKKLSKKFFESIETQNNELIRDAMSNIREEMDDKTPEEMDSLMEKMNVFLEMNLIELSKNDELKESFVKELCELL